MRVRELLLLAAFALSATAFTVASSAPRSGEASERSTEAEDQPQCRCAQRTLDEYFTGADEVVIATLARAEEGGDGEDATAGGSARWVTLHMVMAERPWKSAGTGEGEGERGAGSRSSSPI